MNQKDADYITGLFHAIGKIENGDIRDKVIRTIYNAWKQGNFDRIEKVHQFEPARDSIEYTNVEHTNQVSMAAEKMAAMLKEEMGIKVNMDYLLAGAALHDVDKMVIFDSETGGYTPTGRLFAHAVMGASLALREGLPEEVAHIIGAHSARYSPVPPRTIEAMIVRQVDELVAHAVYMSRGLDMGTEISRAVARIS